MATAQDTVNNLLNDLVSSVTDNSRYYGGSPSHASSSSSLGVTGTSSSSSLDPTSSMDSTALRMMNSMIDDDDDDNTPGVIMKGLSTTHKSSSSSLPSSSSSTAAVSSAASTGSTQDGLVHVEYASSGSTNDPSMSRRHVSTQQSSYSTANATTSTPSITASSPFLNRSLRTSSNITSTSSVDSPVPGSTTSSGLNSPTLSFWASSNPSSSSYSQDKLFVRVGQPIENCDLEPWASVLMSNRSLSNDNNTQPPLSFRWLRSKDRLPCAHSKCITNRAYDNDCDQATKNKAQEVLTNVRKKNTQIQCFLCVGSRNPSPAVFCNARCLRRGWREHAQYHTNPVFYNPPVLDNNNNSVYLDAHLRSVDKDEIFWKLAHDIGLSNSSPTSMHIHIPGPNNNNNNSKRTLGIQVNGSSEEPEIRSSTSQELNDPPPPGWVVIGDTKTICPTAADIGHRLRLEVTAKISEDRSLRQSAESSFVLPRPPSGISRKFVLADNVISPLSTDASPADIRNRERTLRNISIGGIRDKYGSPTGLRVLNYNILAEIYASQQQYPYVPAWQLSWSYRSKVILKEIANYDADVICLQEVQSDSFDSEILPYFSKLGYAALYKTKTREVGLHGKIDGCAIFFKSSRLRLQPGGGYFVVELNDAATSVIMAEMTKLDSQWNSGRSNLTMNDYEVQRARLESATKRLCKDNVAQVAILNLFAGPDFTKFEHPVPLVVVCTHLHWDPALADVKLWQMSCLIKEVEKLQTSAINSVNGNPNNLVLQPGQTSLPMLLCGDLNSEPDSAVYKLLSNNVVHGQRMDLTANDLPNDPCSILPSRRPLGHSMSLASLYQQILRQEPNFTNLTRDFTGTLDYVFTNIDCVKPLSAVQIPTADILIGKYASSSSLSAFASSSSLPNGTNATGATTTGPTGATGSSFGSTIFKSDTNENTSSTNNGNNDLTLSSNSTSHNLTSSVMRSSSTIIAYEDEEDSTNYNSIALPNGNHSSDHLPLIFEVDIAPWYPVTYGGVVPGSILYDELHNHANNGNSTNNNLYGFTNGANNLANDLTNSSNPTNTMVGGNPMNPSNRNTNNFENKNSSTNNSSVPKGTIPPAFRENVMSRLANKGLQNSNSGNSSTVSTPLNTPLPSNTNTTTNNNALLTNLMNKMNNVSNTPNSTPTGLDNGNTNNNGSNTTGMSYSDNLRRQMLRRSVSDSSTNNNTGNTLDTNSMNYNNDPNNSNHTMGGLSSNTVGNISLLAMNNGTNFDGTLYSSNTNNTSFGSFSNNNNNSSSSSSSTNNTNTTNLFRSGSSNPLTNNNGTSNLSTVGIPSLGPNTFRTSTNSSVNNNANNNGSANNNNNSGANSNTTNNTSLQQQLQNAFLGSINFSNFLNNYSTDMNGNGTPMDNMNNNNNGNNGTNTGGMNPFSYLASMNNGTNNNNGNGLSFAAVAAGRTNHYNNGNQRLPMSPLSTTGSSNNAGNATNGPPPPMLLADLITRQLGGNNNNNGNQ